MSKRHASIEPVHPGEILRADAFPALGVTKPALADALGVSRQSLHDIMTLKRGVTPDMAVRLEAVMARQQRRGLRFRPRTTCGRPVRVSALRA